MMGNARTTGTGNRWRIAGWGAAAVLLLLPLVAMQFTDEVDWGLSDFVIFGAMLALAGGAFEWAVKLSPGKTFRAAAGVALAAAFLLVWVNGAVGLVGNEDNPANLMYLGVLIIGIAGAAVTRVRPSGMALTMMAVAVAQLLVPVIALIAGLASMQGMINTFMVTGLFCMLWLVSAWLFRISGIPAESEESF